MFLWRLWLRRSGVAVLALAALVIAIDGRWTVSASAAPAEQKMPPKEEARPEPKSEPTPTGPPPPAMPIIVPPVPTPAPTTPAAAGKHHRGKRKGGSRTGKVNINTATFDQLTQLPRVGPGMADRLLTYRQIHGPFRTLSQLKSVRGFGLKTIRRLEPFLALTGDTTLAVQ